MSTHAPRARAREAKLSLYRDLILDAAERVFAERGFEGTKVADVASEAGVSLGTLYGVFGGKSDLHRALHERRLTELLALVSIPVPPSIDPLSAVLAGVRIYVTFHLDHPDYLRMHLREGVAWTSEAAFHHDVEVQVWQEGQRRMHDLLHAAQQAGDVVDGDPTLLARMVIATHQVILADWVDRGLPAEVEPIVALALSTTVRLLATPAARARLEAP
ncbi:MAG: TetR/AcrR family transcriptional regulator [Alphaproteobacteria bacterium]|nr:TetR/AcrR family transcriptional regulator [Alphaproteobacteria bacterium]